MCEITKAPKMKLQSALKSASADFSEWVADDNIGCEISQRGKRRHRRKQKAKRMGKANAKLSSEITNARKFGCANYKWHQADF